MSLKTQEAIPKLRLTVLPHSSYSPDLTSSDFQLLGALKDALYGKGFGSDDKVIEEVMKWLQVQNSNWHKKGIDALVSGWGMGVDVD